MTNYFVSNVYHFLMIFLIILPSSCFAADLGSRGKRYKAGGVYIGSDPSMSVDGKIVFGSTRYGIGDICTIDANGNNWSRLTFTQGYEGEPEFSPDGKKIVFVSERDGNGEIYVMNSDGSNQLRLTRYKHYDASPSFSPDGHKIIFARNIFDQKDGVLYSHVFVMNSDGSDVKRISHGKVWYTGPRFLPNGKKVIFKKIWQGEDEAIGIGIFNLDGTNELKIKKGFCHYPSFSPDGKKIIFVADLYDTDEWNLYTMELKTLALKRIRLSEDYDIFHPSYVYDGTKVMFLSEVGEKGGQICIMNGDGTDISVISKTY